MSDIVGREMANWIGEKEHVRQREQSAEEEGLPDAERFRGGASATSS